MKKQFLYLIFLSLCINAQAISSSSQIEATSVPSNEVSVAEYHLLEIMDMMMHDMRETGMPKVSVLFSNCYERLRDGVKTLPILDVAALLPELTAYLESMEEVAGLKAPRDDEPSVTASDAIVGKNGCDLTIVVSLLSVIKKRIIRLQELLCKKIEELKRDCFDTKTVLCEKFNQTWTILEDIDEDIFDTKTVLCEKFNQTWTILAALEVDVDLSGVFTKLEDIDDDIFDTKTVLCEKFEQTWTILEDIDRDIFDTKTVLCEKIENLNPNPCELRIPISEPTTIAQPGSYCLTQDIAGSITIDATNLDLDLNNKRITAGSDGIKVSNQADVTVKNGIIEGGTNGVVVSFCTNVEIFDIDFIDNPVGINIVTSSCVRVDDCTFRGFTDAALTIDDTNNGKFTNCMMKFNDDSPSVVFAQNSVNLFFKNLFMNNNSSSLSLNVFKLSNCENCVIKECQANNNLNTDGSLDGFFINNCNNIKFINCVANGNEARIGVSGFINNNNCEDVLYDHCCSNSNVADNASAQGFFASSGKKTIFESCIANDNFGSGDAAVGFKLILEESSCVLNCVAKRNTDNGNTSNGIFLNTCIDCLVKGNIAIDNDDIGIQVTGGTLTTGVLSNYSSGQGTNYSIAGGMIPIATLDFSAGTITAGTSKWHNIETTP